MGILFFTWKHECSNQGNDLVLPWCVRKRCIAFMQTRFVFVAATIFIVHFFFRRHDLLFTPRVVVGTCLCFVIRGHLQTKERERNSDHVCGLVKEKDHFYTIWCGWVTTSFFLSFLNFKKLLSDVQLFVGVCPAYQITRASLTIDGRKNKDPLSFDVRSIDQ